MADRDIGALDAEYLIGALGLSPHLEGGYFAETYRSDERTKVGDRYSAPRSLSTAIYYLLAPKTCSRMHRLKSDEIYHFYLGDPVTMVNLHPDGSSDLVMLGQEILNGQRLQHTVPRGVWQGARLADGGDFALLGTTVAPGFDYADYESGARNDLIEDYPDMRDMIVRLTEAP
jgi:uncharacterized protein